MWPAGKRGSRQPGFGRCLAVVLGAYLLLLGLAVHLWHPHPRGSPLSRYRALQGEQQSSGSSVPDQVPPLQNVGVPEPQQGESASFLAVLLQSNSHEAYKRKGHVGDREARTGKKGFNSWTADGGSDVLDLSSTTDPAGDSSHGKDTVNLPLNHGSDSHVHHVSSSTGTRGGRLDVSFQRVGDVFVYGAYLDARTAGRVQVRLLVLRPRLTDSPGLTCTFPLPPAWQSTWTGQGLGALGTRVTPEGATVAAARYELCENHDKKYGGWIYTCTMPPGLPFPSHVILESSVRPTAGANSSREESNAGRSETGEQTQTLRTLLLREKDTKSQFGETVVQTEKVQRPSTENAAPAMSAQDNEEVSKVSNPLLVNSERSNSTRNLLMKGFPPQTKHSSSMTAESSSNLDTLGLEEVSPGSNSQTHTSAPTNSPRLHPMQESATGVRPEAHRSSTQRKETAASLTVPLTPLAAESDQLSLGVCVPPLWGHVSVLHLIQYVELSRLLGASRVILYQYNVSATIARLLQFLSQEGAVTVVGWRPPEEAMGGGGVWYEGQALAVQHCLYNFMPRFQYLAFFDIDEVLVPKHHNTWQDLLEALASNHEAFQREYSKSFPSNRLAHNVPKADNQDGSKLQSGANTPMSKQQRNEEKVHLQTAKRESIREEKVSRKLTVILTKGYDTKETKYKQELPKHTDANVTVRDKTMSISNEESSTHNQEPPKPISEQIPADDVSDHRHGAVAGFSFQSVFFDPRQLPAPSQRMPFMQALQRTQHPSTVRSKVIVKPQRVFEMGIHHVSRLLSQGASVLKVDQSQALLHHYRPCVVTFDPNMTCFPTVTDDSLLRFSSQLEERVHRMTRAFLAAYQGLKDRS